MSGDREWRGGERGYAADVAFEAREQFAPRTPVEEAEERAHQERLWAESLQLEVEQLGEAPAAEWAERKQVLARKLESLKGRLRSRIGDTSERAERDRGATVATVMAVGAALERATRPRVPGVAGEDEVQPAVVNKTIAKGELLEWFAGLPAGDRAAVWRRYERASTRQRDPKQPDEFARALANYVAAVRIRDDLQHLVHMSAHQIAGWRKHRDGGGEEHRAADGGAAGRGDRDRGDIAPAAQSAPKQAPPDASAAAAGPAPDASAGLVGAAHAVSLAAGRAHIALESGRLPDPELAGLRGALEALADALHAYAGARSKADEHALRTAFRDGEGVADLLATRHDKAAEVLLRQYLGFALRQAGAAETSSAARHSPEELRTTATGSVNMLQHSRATAGQSPSPPSDPILYELDRAIATTHGWTETLIDGDPTSARRLSRAVLDQYVFVATAKGELDEVLGRRVTRSTATVLEAYVHALARSVEREDQAQAALERARRLARRQALDLVDDALDQARDATADLAGADRATATRALQDERALAGRKDQLEARLARGGKVPGAALDDLVIDAREQAFTDRIRALDSQSHQLAIALDRMDDGVAGWLANGGDQMLPLLVSDLHGLGRVAREIRNRYRARLAGVATSQRDEPNRDTPAWIAERGAAIDQAEERLDAWRATGHFDDRLQAAYDKIETAQIRSLIVNIGIQIGVAIVAGGAARMASKWAQGAMEARAGGELVSAANLAPATVASGLTDLAVTSLGQKGLTGDRSSLITIGAVNLTSIMVLGRLQKHFQGLDDLMKDTAKLSIVWGKAASVGGRAALQGVSITEEMVLGAAVNYAVRRAGDAQASSPTDDDATAWLLQGASIAIGRGVAGRIEHLQAAIAEHRTAGTPDSPAVRRLLEQAQVVHPLALEAEATGNPEAGRALVPPARELLAAEAALQGGSAHIPADDPATLSDRLDGLKRVDDPNKVEESLKTDEMFRQRKDDNESLVSDPERLRADLERAGITAERFNEMRNGSVERGGDRLPLAFEDWAQFDDFKADFARMMSTVTVNGRGVSAEAKNIGTATGFYSGNPKKPLGHHFDRLAPENMGDVDIELVSPELVAHMLRKDPVLNEKVLIGGQKVIFKNEVRVGTGFHSEFPQVADFCARWSSRLGREVDIKLKADLTPVAEVPRPTKGPIELYRAEIAL